MKTRHFGLVVAVLLSVAIACAAPPTKPAADAAAAQSQPASLAAKASTATTTTSAAASDSAPVRTVIAPSEKGALTPAFIDELRAGFKMDAPTRVIRNAVTNTSIDDLALNRDAIDRNDGHFTNKIEIKGVTNQKSSGRCWMFAGFNTMRPKVMREKKLPSFEFSTAYLQFWDKMEKSNLYLETMIEMRDTDYLDREWELVHEWTLDDGGWWSFVVDLIDKYGVVPKNVMPETQSSENTDTMNHILERKMRVDAATMHRMHREGKSVDELRAYKQKAMGEVYRFLVMNLGEPPREFMWRYEAEPEEAVEAGDADDAPADAKADEKEKPGADTATNVTPLVKYTPQSFYREFVGVPLHEYVCIYNDPTNAMGKHYSFKNAHNIVGAGDMDFVNTTSDALKMMAMKSVLANQPVWFAADMGKDESTQLGLMADRLYDYGPLFGTDVRLSKADRIRYRAGGSNHAMVFMGVDVQDGKPAKWLVENSWGEDHGEHGTWTLFDDWFDEHVYCIIVHKSFVPDDIMKVFDEKPTVLPPWYPGALGVR